MSTKFSKEWLFFLAGLVGLVVLSLVLGIWLGEAKIFRAVFGVVYVVFLPGLFLSYIFWWVGKIDILERILYSLIFSILAVPFVVFVVFKLGAGITTINIFFEILALVFVELLILTIFRLRCWRKSKVKSPGAKVL